MDHGQRNPVITCMKWNIWGFQYAIERGRLIRKKSIRMRKEMPLGISCLIQSLYYYFV